MCGQFTESPPNRHPIATTAGVFGDVHLLHQTTQSDGKKFKILFVQIILMITGHDQRNFLNY